MSFESGMSPADLAAVTGNNRNNDGWGDNGSWWIILFLIFAFCGWGNGFGGFGGFGGGMNGATTTAATQADIQRGFDNQGVMNKLNGIEQGICSLGYDQLNQMNGINTNVMQTGFGIQQAVNAGTVTGMQSANAIQSQLADCCCTTQRAIDGVNYNLATQSCNLQNTVTSNTRDVVDSQRNGTQAILDKLCQMEYNGLNDKYQAVLAENQALRFQASQTDQNAFIQAVSNSAVAQLRTPTPIPSYSVPNPYTGCCGTYSGCNCG